jgi:hypothetical protein
MLIKLQLNPNEPLDQQIEGWLDLIYVDPKSLSAAGTAVLDELIKCGQKLLKQEWDKVKQEAKYGDLQTSWALRF